MLYIQDVSKTAGFHGKKSAFYYPSGLALGAEDRLRSVPVPDVA
ncbi:MAG: hypothetical protein Q7W55_12615 [Pseudohongiella sp.]|nr:hypothetical protein [Pseudohongiella sp.]MDO9519981.1 hypothetical protein [Pseudohongiella sp.]MDP2127144.1 hypothetical protein [Pseudohongiella sp.]